MKSGSFYQSQWPKSGSRQSFKGTCTSQRVIQLLEPEAQDPDSVLVAKLLRMGVTPKVVAVLVPNRVLPLGARAISAKKPVVCLGSELWQTL